MKKLDIIIVNWNLSRQLYECLYSVVTAEKYGFELDRVVVIDNASTDDSLSGLGKIKLPLYIIKNSTNRGFAAACNQGAKESKADYLLFLNPDTKLFTDSLTKPVDFMERKENHSIGICGIKLLDEQGIFSTSCARFPSIRIYFGAATGLSKLFPKAFPKHLMSSVECEGGGVVDQIIGAFFLVRGELFRNLKGFDERFFVYFEEVDFSLRAKRLGYSSYLLTKASAYHKGGGCSGSIKATRLFYSLRSRLQYGDKHFSSVDKLALFVITIFLEFGSRTFAALLTRRSSQLKETISGYRKLFENLIGGFRNGN